MKSISISRDTLLSLLDSLSLAHPDNEEEAFEIIGRNEVLEFIEKFRTQSEEIKEIKTKQAAFQQASENLAVMLDFKNSPLKAVAKITSIINKPQLHEKELGPILELFKPKELKEHE